VIKERSENVKSEKFKNFNYHCGKSKPKSPRDAKSVTRAFNGKNRVHENRLLQKLTPFAYDEPITNTKRNLISTNGPSTKLK